MIARIATSLIVLTLVSPLQLGCGGEGGEATDAEQTATAALTVSGQAEGQIFAELPALPSGAGWVQGTLQSFTISGTLTSPAGGTATVAGAGGESSTGYAMQLSITFDDWVSSATGQLLNGTLSSTYQVTTLAPRSFSMTVSGTVMVGAKPAIPVKVDLQVTVTKGQLTYCGTVAGQPVGSGPCA